ncbi:hypothetical protein CEXT_493431 [Caerostris extrusa]|uniref:Uncharacterized protein n=1 Tax=Caerostris extrusa TaxID=172846 RepID=A0AAV4XW81_CAEEX|nr:hypothetical protein CEXT_493431 [Caerostris extrusa]
MLHRFLQVRSRILSACLPTDAGDLGIQAPDVIRTWTRPPSPDAVPVPPSVGGTSRPPSQNGGFVTL